MHRFRTLIEVLAHRAEETPARVAFTFLGKPCTYAEMWADINRFASYLAGLGVGPGERVVMALPNGRAFFAAFYGAQRIGGTAVPVSPGSGPDRIAFFAKLCEARVVVVPDSRLAGLKSLGAEHALAVITVPESQGSRTNRHFPHIQPDDLAFIQFTSGSTGNPKGVLLSHDNLLTNLDQMSAGMAITKEERFVSWLPVYHDMGLILKTMAPFYLGAEVHLLPASLRDLHPWLDTIQTRRATFTAAPDFAYRLCLRHVDPADYDLSSLRVALNAAEPVRASTIGDFEAAFGLENVMVAGYGLAEATVGVSMWPPGSTPRIDPRGFVSVGPPFPGVSVQIIEDGEPLPAGEIGEIAIRSAANSAGYLNNPQETARRFQDDGYLLSGDLGYLDEDGNLYIVGRRKNIIKRGGETISPQEVEEIVDQQAAVRYAAAVGVDKGGVEGEQVYVFAETREDQVSSENARYELALNIVNAIHARMGFRPGRVYLLKPRAIPMTHNGKIQHTRLRERYLDGSLREAGSILFPDY